MKLITIFLLSLLVVGCATVSPTCNVPRASGDEAINIVIYRPNGVVGILYATPMSIDHCRVHSLSNNSYIVYKLPPGIHRIAVEKRTLELGRGAHVEQDFESGKTYYLRQNVNLVAGLTVVDENQAFSEMPKLKKAK